MSSVVLLGLVIPQTVFSDFYVIPIGQSSIPASAVKSIMSENVPKNTTGTVYTVPENKVFVLKEFQILGSYGEIIYF